LENLEETSGRKRPLYRIGMSFYLEHYREFVSEEVSATNLDIAMSYT
jgi:hypothetical protein